MVHLGTYDDLTRRDEYVRHLEYKVQELNNHVDYLRDKVDMLMRGNGGSGGMSQVMTSTHMSSYGSHMPMSHISDPTKAWFGEYTRMEPIPRDNEEPDEEEPQVTFTGKKRKKTMLDNVALVPLDIDGTREAENEKARSVENFEKQLQVIQTVEGLPEDKLDEIYVKDVKKRALEATKKMKVKHAKKLLQKPGWLDKLFFKIT